jgi:hypothetical protein
VHDGDTNYPIREEAAAPPYLLDITKYSGSWYVVAGASGENRVYVYQDPMDQRKNNPERPLIPAHILHVPQPNFLAFSSNAQFIAVENGTQFAVYDAEADEGYAYAAPQPLDAPQVHATWMDGNRLMYVSGGKAIMADYDNTNRQTLMAASPAYLLGFDRDYRYVFTLAPSKAAGSMELTETSLLIPKDQ